MSYYRMLLELMIVNACASLTKTLYPDSLPLGKLIGFLQIIVIVMIYVKSMKKKDLLLFLYLLVFDFIVLFRIVDSSIDLENMTYFTSTCLMLWKFTDVNMRNRLKREIELMGKKPYICANILLITIIVALFFSQSWYVVNGQRVFYGFCESGHKLSGNLCFIGSLYLVYFSDKQFRLPQLVYYAVPFVLLSLTGSRTYMVSYLVILIVLYLTKLRYYKLKQLLLPSVLVGMVYYILNSSVMERFIVMGTNKYISTNFLEAASSGRLIWWGIDINEFLRFDFLSKMIGRGFTYLYQLNEREYGLLISAHNDFITLAVSMGLLGLIGYTYIIIRWFMKKNNDGKRPFVAIGLTASMYLWNAMISGVFGAQQYMYANILVGILLLEPLKKGKRWTEVIIYRKKSRIESKY